MGWRDQTSSRRRIRLPGGRASRYIMKHLHSILLLTACLCVLGQAPAAWSCEPTELGPGSRCDGIDNDCNGEIDECNEDFRPPVLRCPMDVLVECPTDTQPDRDSLIGYARATDDCGKAKLSYNDSRENMCGNIYIVSREWHAVDNCGNVSTCTQMITVMDNTPPTLSCPDSVTIELTANPAPNPDNEVGFATATDTCSEFEITFEDEEISPCAKIRVIIRTWIAKDACDNESRAEQIVTLTDTEPPVLQIPDPVTLECPADTDPGSDRNTGIARCNDASVEISFIDEVTKGCGITRIITRMWTATDACGNVTSAPQIITLIDVVSPAINVSTTAEDGGLIGLHFDATDDCISPSVFGMIDVGDDKIPVTDGKLLNLTRSSGPPSVRFDHGVLIIATETATLSVHASDGCNADTVELDLFGEQERHIEETSGENPLP